MDSKSRLDYLRTEAERQAAYGGRSQKLNAISSSLLGLNILVCSFILLRHERLQIHNYLTFTPNKPQFCKPFPTELLGCAAANTASSIIQIISSLMFLFQDIKIHVWKWANFTVLMVSSLSAMVLMYKEYSEIELAQFYFIALVANSGAGFLFLITDLCCCPRQSPHVAPAY